MQVDGLCDSVQISCSDLFNLEVVEVIKGLNLVFGGVGISGGSINMVSKQFKVEVFIYLGVGLGMDCYWCLILDINQLLEGFGELIVFCFNFMVYYNDVVGCEQIDKQCWGIVLFLIFGLDILICLILSYFYQCDDNFFDYGVLVLNGCKLDGVSCYDYFGWCNLDEEWIDNDVVIFKFEYDFSDDFQLQNFICYFYLYWDMVIFVFYVNQKGLLLGCYLLVGL